MLAEARLEKKGGKGLRHILSHESMREEKGGRHKVGCLLALLISLAPRQPLQYLTFTI